VRFNHIPEITVTADFAEENGQQYRYRLDVALKNPPPANITACVIMMNPSYACVEHADKSVQFMERVVFLKGLPGSRNDAAIRAAFEESDVIIVAWGCANPFRERITFAQELLASMPGKRLYRTSKHPSRGRYAGFILPW